MLIHRQVINKATADLGTEWFSHFDGLNLPTRFLKNWGKTQLKMEVLAMNLDMTSYHENIN